MNAKKGQKLFLSLNVENFGKQRTCCTNFPSLCLNCMFWLSWTNIEHQINIKIQLNSRKGVGNWILMFLWRLLFFVNKHILLITFPSDRKKKYWVFSGKICFLTNWCPLVDFLGRKLNLWEEKFNLKSISLRPDLLIDNRFSNSHLQDFFQCFYVDCEKQATNGQLYKNNSNTTTSSTDLSDFISNSNTSSSGNTRTTNTNSSSNNSSNNSNQLNGQDSSFPAGGKYKHFTSVQLNRTFSYTKTFNCCKNVWREIENLFKFNGQDTSNCWTWRDRKYGKVTTCVSEKTLISR